MTSFGDVAEAFQKIEMTGYLPTTEMATAAFLADRMDKPILVEGAPGVGKTQFAKSVAQALDRELIRLQCYEGLDETRALYEWEYAKQLLYTQILKDKIGETLRDTQSLSEAADRISQEEAVFFSERFLLPRPLLQAILSPRPVLLLIDEIDKSDPEFEPLLLELLSDYAVTIPELGTLKAKHIPRAVLTSNNTRELSDALKRRCLHLNIEFPSLEREMQIVRTRLPGLAEQLISDLVFWVQKLRQLDLKKSPSIAETLDWAQSLVVLNATELTPSLINATLSLVLKNTSDLETAQASLAPWQVSRP